MTVDVVRTSLEGMWTHVKDPATFVQQFDFSLEKNQVKVLQQFSDNLMDVHMFFKGDWLFRPRDAVWRIFQYKAEDFAVVVYKSIEREDTPPVKEYIRGDWRSYLLVEKIDDKSCKVATIYFMDPRGAIPVWMVNSFARDLLFNVRKFLKLIEHQ
jgi:hypothetical protein